MKFVSHDILEHISEAPDYEAVVSTLEPLFVKPQNKFFARHVLATRNQDTSETVDGYYLTLNKLSKDCNSKDFSVQKNRDEYIRDSFISGLRSNVIRQRLLEKNIFRFGTSFHHD